jgi:hypothetical protein
MASKNAMKTSSSYFFLSLQIMQKVSGMKTTCKNIAHFCTVWSLCHVIADEYSPNDTHWTDSYPVIPLFTDTIER